MKKNTPAKVRRQVSKAHIMKTEIEQRFVSGLLRAPLGERLKVVCIILGGFPVARFVAWKDRLFHKKPKGAK